MINNLNKSRFIQYLLFHDVRSCGFLHLLLNFTLTNAGNIR